jgi:hypothetical protein
MLHMVPKEMLAASEANLKVARERCLEDEAEMAALRSVARDLSEKLAAAQVKAIVGSRLLSVETSARSSQPHR